MQVLRKRYKHLLGLLVLITLLGVAMGIHWFKAPAVERLQFTSDSTSLPLNRFRPPGTPPETGWTTILMFHGGAWQRSGVGQWTPHCRGWQRLGIQCFSAGYRVAEDHGTGVREAVIDARAALHFLRSHAAELNINPQGLVIGGGSSGGHLAALLASGQSGLAAPEPAAGLLLFNPMLNLEPGRPDHQYVAAFWEQVSPHHQLANKQAPTLILLGDRDRELPLPVAQAYCDKVRTLGGHCELDVAAGHGHGFFNRSYSRWQYLRTLWRSYTFLQQIAD